MSILDRVVVSAPCPMSWDNMDGDSKIRFCAGCSRNVYNLSAMTEDEAEAFVEANGSSQCMTFYRRADGKIMTDNCPKGLRAVEQRVKNWMKVAAGFMISACSFGVAAQAQKAPEQAEKGKTIVRDGKSAPEQATRGKVLIRDSQTGPAQQHVNALGVNGQPSNSSTVIPVSEPTRTAGFNSIIDPPAGTRTMGEPMVHPAGGISVMPQPVPKKNVLIPSNDCKPNKTSDPVAKPTEPISGDKRAYDLFTDAQNSKLAGKDLVALTQFKAALNLSKTMKNADPLFIKMLESEIKNLNEKTLNGAGK